MTTNQRKRAARESYGFIAIVAGILVLLNILGVFFFGRLDLTAKRLFSLSDGSKRLAASLKDRMEVDAYFTENLPPPFNATERYVRDILAEYEAASKGKIRVRYINPDTDEKAEEAEADGVRKVSHQVIENDGVSVREGFRGIAFKLLGETKAIPVVEDTSGLEYRISQLIKEMVGEKAPVGVLSGHQGPTLEKGLSSLKQASPTYDIKETSAAQPIAKNLRALLLVEPQTELSEAELKNIDAYVMDGGSLGIFGGAMKVSLEGAEPTASPAKTGVNRLLDKWGVKISDGIVADARCGRAPMQTSFGISVFVPYPPVPIIAFSETENSHPTLFRLDQVAMPFTSPLALKGKSKDLGFKRTVLAKSSKQSWLLTGDSISLRPKHPREWSQSGRSGPFALAVALEGKLPSALGQGKGKNTSHVIVAGTAGFLRDEFLPRADESGQRDLGSALAFALNTVDWLAQDSDLIAIRAKNVEDPALEVPAPVMEAQQEAQAAAEAKDKGAVEEALEKRKDAISAWDTKKALYRWLNTLGVPLAFALFGVFRWRSRKAKKAAFKL